LLRSKLEVKRREKKGKGVTESEGASPDYPAAKKTEKIEAESRAIVELPVSVESTRSEEAKSSLREPLHNSKRRFDSRYSLSSLRWTHLDLSDRYCPVFAV